MRVVKWPLDALGKRPREYPSPDTWSVGKVYDPITRKCPFKLAEKLDINDRTSRGPTSARSRDSRIYRRSVEIQFKVSSEEKRR